MATGHPITLLLSIRGVPFNSAEGGRVASLTVQKWSNVAVRGNRSVHDLGVPVPVLQQIEVANCCLGS
eukprot:12923684-Prorocentrum_lima.AAC.1